MRDFSDRAELTELADALRPVASSVAECGLSWILVGASARDLILHHAQGWPLGRATGDVDVAVLVPDWGGYEALRRLTAFLWGLGGRR